MILNCAKKNIAGSLEDLGDVDIALGPHLEEKTCDRFFPLSVVLVRCLHLQDLLVLQGTTKSTRKKSQEHSWMFPYVGIAYGIQPCISLLWQGKPLRGHSLCITTFIYASAARGPFLMTLICERFLGVLFLHLVFWSDTYYIINIGMYLCKCL